jgi:hypothetical protein
MRHRLLLALLILSTELLFSQNLVLNPGLENYIACPGFGQFGPAWVNDWYKPSAGSSDYYHYNCPSVAPPANASPRTGNGEGGIILYNFGTEYREYVTATLSQPLTAGKIYYVEFYLSLNPGYIQAIKEAGAYLSDSVPGFFPNALSINVVPQINYAGGFLTYGWTKISGHMTAAGGESYITIGNFMNDSNTTVSTVGAIGSYGSYYFIDDVWVSGADSTSTGIVSAAPLTFHAIPTLVNRNVPVNMDPAMHDFNNVTVTVYNSSGAISSAYDLKENGFTLHFDKLSPGIYFYRMQTQKAILSTGKFILQ